MRAAAHLIAALLALIVCVAPMAPAGAGTIKGAVRFAGSTVEPQKLKVSVDQWVCGTTKDAGDLVLSPEQGIRNVVVSLVTPPPGARWSVSPPVQIDQKQCVFVPRVIVAPVGGTVEFLNSDRLLHNLHSASTDNAVVNRTQPKGRTIPIVFSKPEIIRIDCDLHPWMRAWVVVAEHPFYAVTDDRGEFVLQNVPPGKYVLQIWQETLGTMQQDVTVSDVVTPLTIEMRAK